MTREQHKQLFGKLEEMFWGKETKLICVLGKDPDDYVVCVAGPDQTYGDVVGAFKTTVHQWAQAAAMGENQD